MFKQSLCVQFHQNQTGSSNYSHHCAPSVFHYLHKAAPSEEVIMTKHVRAGLYDNQK